MGGDYTTLPIEDGWVDYLRTRLPYSFKRIQEIQTPRGYQLDEPFLIASTPFSSTYHNYWKRGIIFYLMGKIGDCHSLSRVGAQVRTHIKEPAYSQTFGLLVPQLLPFSHDIWNTLQVTKMWEQAGGDILERERVAMSNVSLAIELCLKAVTAHARYRESGTFTFDFTHDINRLFDRLPPSLQGEMLEESVKFAVEYNTYYQEIRAKVENMHGGHMNSIYLTRDPALWEAARQRWVQLLQQTDDSPYTVYSNTPDPTVAPSATATWFTDALACLKSIEGMDKGTYFRYAPFHDVDELPTDAIYYVLLLGRFLYEYLFPMVPKPS